MFKKVVALTSLLVSLSSTQAFAGEGHCNLELFKITLVKTPMGDVVRQEPISTKRIALKVPASAEREEASYQLAGKIGIFSIFANFEPGEQTFSNLTIQDKTHALDFGGDRQFVSMRNMASKQGVSVWCEYTR